MKASMPICDRLKALPPKVGRPFHDLLERGYVSSDVLETVLDAGELAGDTSKLLGFAIGYLHLRSNGVQVADVVRMAKAQGRRIRLDWSPKRWESEHDSLSRFETLARLSAENVSYDLSRFDVHLPKRFPGYLIRTSRRLGMEGLRQRHCVATYHRQLTGGHLAIASVFVNRKRWTVSLGLTGNDEEPLRVGQIRTRFDVPPTAEDRRAICEAFGVDPQRSRPVSGRPERMFLYKDNLRRILPVLRQHRVERVTVTFEGSGDSGAIDNVEYVPSSFDDKEVAVQILTQTAEFQDGQWVRSRAETEQPLEQAIRELTEDYLDETDVDWCNNDGGFGDLVIDVAAGTVTLDVNVRLSNSETVFCAELDIATGEEIG